MNPGAQGQGLMTPDLAPHPGLEKSMGSMRSSSRTTPQSVIDELQYNNRRPRTSGKSPRTEDLVRKKAESEERFRSIVSSFKSSSEIPNVFDTGASSSKPHRQHSERSHSRRSSSRRSNHERNGDNPIDRSASSGKRRSQSARGLEDERKGDNPIDRSTSSHKRRSKSARGGLEDEGYQVDHSELSAHRHSKHKKRRSKSGRSRSSRSTGRSSARGSLPGVSLDGENSWGIKSVVSDGMEKWTHFEHSESEFSESASEYDPQIESLLSPPTLMTPNSLAAKSLLAASSETPSSLEGSASAGFPDGRSLRNLVMMDSSSETQLSRSSRRSSKHKRKKKSSRSISSSKRSSKSSSKPLSPKSPPQPPDKKAESMRSQNTYSSLPTPAVIAAGVQQVADKLEVDMSEGHPSSPSTPNSPKDKETFGLFLNDDDSAKLRKKAARNANRRSNVRRRRKNFTPEGSELELHDDETMSTISYDPVLDLLAAAQVHEDAIHREARAAGGKYSGGVDSERVLSEEEKQRILSQVVEVAKQQQMMEKAKFNSSRNLEDVLEASLEGGETTEDETPSKQSSSSHLEPSSKRSSATPLSGFLSTNEITSALTSQERNSEFERNFVDVEANRPTVKRISEEPEKQTFKETCIQLAKNRTFIAIAAILLIITIAIISVLVALNRPTAVIDDPVPTASPVDPTTVMTDAEILSIITELSPSDSALLADLDSPQGKAYAWLDQSNVFKSESTQVVQRYSLATLFFATDGENWMNKEGWLSDDDECDWFSSHGNPCDENGNFIRLELQQNQLNGGIPEELSLLTSIRSILLPGNALLGSFPSSLTKLGSLDSLDLDNNEFERKFPLSILALTNLKSLSLNLNRFTGDLPPQIAALSNLESLCLAGNRFTSGVPTEIIALTDLKVLNLEYNEMSGPIIPELGSLRNLEHLKLDFNVFNLAVPSELGLLAKLRTFGCNECSLFGVLPSEIGFLGRLETFELFSNQLTGTLPREMGSMTSLRRVNLGANSIGGSLPTDLGRLSNIQSFDMNLNRLSGTVPSEFGSIRSKSFVFYLQSNQITGAIPPEVCKVLIENPGQMIIDNGQVKVCDCESCHPNARRSAGVGGSHGASKTSSRGPDVFDTP